MKDDLTADAVIKSLPRPEMLLEDDPTHCECGWLLDDHPPLPEVKPWASWQAVHQRKGPSQPPSGWAPMTIK